MSYQVLARKWRPRNFAEMVGQEHVLRALSNALDSGRLHHAFLFTGTRGVGKTTIARILAKSLNCETGISSKPCGECRTCKEIDEGRFVDLLEVDAASRTKVEDTRELLDNVQYAPTRGRYKVYLIDEVHMLSGHSFNALLKTLEEPPPHVKFLLATTDPQKLPITILSRCLQFNLRRLSPERIQGHLQHILQQEQVPCEDMAVVQLSRAADGSMRDALSLLDQAIAYGAGKVSEEEVRAMLGTIEQHHIYELLDALAAGDGVQLINKAQELAQQVPDFAAVLSDLVTTLQSLALLQLVPDAYQEAMGDREHLFALAEKLSAEDIQLYYQIGLTGRRDLPLAPDPRMGLEMVLLRMLAFRPAEAAGPTGGGKTRSTSSTTNSQTTSTPAASPTVKSVQAAASAAVREASPPTVAARVEEPAVDRFVPPAVPASEWHEITAALPVSGMLRQLADQCVLVAKRDDAIELALDPIHQPLLTKEREQQLQEALEKYFARAMRLVIEVRKSESETPAARQTRQQEEKQQAAEQAILQDSNVQNIVDAFNAQVNVGSVQALD